MKNNKEKSASYQVLCNQHISISDIPKLLPIIVISYGSGQSISLSRLLNNTYYTNTNRFNRTSLEEVGPLKEEPKKALFKQVCLNISFKSEKINLEFIIILQKAIVLI
jgi:hypothetical protein